MGAAIVVAGLRHRYDTPSGELIVIDGLDVAVPHGGYLSVTGRSGTGKSTLLAVLGGLEKPQTGTVVVGETDLASIGGDALAAYRRTTVGFVFQHFGLLEHLTALENVELAATLTGAAPRSRRPRARDLLGAVGLAHREGHRPLQLSGGERQRVAIARALANDPHLLLADEPTGNLDDDSTAAVVELLEDAWRMRGCTLVVVTHDRGLAARATQRLDLNTGTPEVAASGAGTTRSGTTRWG